MTTIRRFEASDWLQVWPILRSTFASGDTCAFAPTCTEEEIHQAWISQPQVTFVAVSETGAILGTSYIKPNQPGLGSHVCNCGYVVAHAARTLGIATMLCEHSQTEAVRLGYRAMQFNLVVSTNTGAVALWQKLGFAIVATLPAAFQHSDLGYVDAYVMYKNLILTEASEN